MTRGGKTKATSLRKVAIGGAAALALIAPVTAHAGGKIKFDNDSSVKWKIDLFKGDDNLRCRPFGIPYKRIRLKPGEVETARCRGEGRGGCYVEIEVQDFYGQFRSLLNEDADWSCAKVNGDARMRLTGFWNAVNGYSLDLRCRRTDDPLNPEKSCLIRYVD